MRISPTTRRWLRRRFTSTIAGFKVYKNPSASQGPAELLVLNLLEGYDLKALKHNSAEYIHAGVEAVKLGFADRDKYMGDMNFIQIPYEGLLSKEYAAEAPEADRSGKGFARVPARFAEKYMKGVEPVDRPLDVQLSGRGDHEGDTSYIAVVDKDRNMITFTPSLHSGFGTGVVMGDLGFVFNCRGDYYSMVPGHANALEPGKRPRSTLQGTLVTKGRSAAHGSSEVRGAMISA